MTPGTVLFDDKFKFHDGNIGQKLFVVLNNGSEGIYVAAKTTSRGDRYGVQHGCQILDRFPNYYFVKGSCFLNENTWIQLDAFYEFKSSELMQKVLTSEINRIGVLEQEQTTELLICATHSEDLTQHQEIIIDGALNQAKQAATSKAAC